MWLDRSASMSVADLVESSHGIKLIRPLAAAMRNSGNHEEAEGILRSGPCSGARFTRPEAFSRNIN